MAHTSLRQVYALSSSDETVWVATGGGVFSYTAGEMQTFTASDGLHSVQVQAVAFDARRDVVWIGYQDGVIDRLDATTGVVRSYLDIARADRFTSRQIHRLVVHNDSLLVATSFGLVVFDPDKEEVRDTYSQLGTMTPATSVYDVTVAPTPNGDAGFWLATDEGIAYAAVHTVNLQDPTAWVVETLGLPSEETRSVAFFNGNVYAGTMSGLAVRSPDGTYQNLNVSPRIVADLLALPDRLLGTERFALVAVETDGYARRLSAEGFTNPVAVTEGPGGTVWFGDRERGLAAVEIPDVPQTELILLNDGVFPDGPYHSLFSDLAVDAYGTLWAGGVAATGTGFYKLQPPNNWTNYISLLVPELAGRNAFERIHIDSQNNVWVGSSGHGLVQVTADGALFVIDETNSTLRAPKGESNTSYVIIGGIASEEDGLLWVTNKAASQPLHSRTIDGTWTGISEISCSGFSSSGYTFERILVDSFGQKWVFVVDEANLNRVLGLLVLDTGDNVTDTVDDVCRFFSQEGSGGQGLPSPAITSVAEGHDGLMWIGTEDGLAFIINSGIVAADQSATPIWPQLADRSQGTFLFSGIKINHVAVDPANRLWIAPDLGASLVQQVEGGYEIVQTFTLDNSPLISNVIMYIAVDGRSGRVYFVTDQGLVSYQGEAITASDEVKTLFVYPNPARFLDGAEPTIMIEGLVDETELRILTSYGEVVNRISTRGGRVRWDGRDLSGHVVPSGMYLVVAVGQNGEGTAYGKVAVIR